MPTNFIAYSGLRRICIVSVRCTQLHMVGALLLPPHAHCCACGLFCDSWSLHSGWTDCQKQHKACSPHAGSTTAPFLCGSDPSVAQQRVMVGIHQFFVDGGKLLIFHCHGTHGCLILDKCILGISSGVHLCSQCKTASSSAKLSCRVL